MKTRLINLFFISVFLLCLTGCESSYQSYQNSDASYYIKSAAQGLNESSSGRTYIGKADSESDCLKKAKDANCTGKYTYYEHSKDCYCN